MTEVIIPFFTSHMTPERTVNLNRVLDSLNTANIVPTIGSNINPSLDYKYNFLEIDILKFNKCIILNRLIDNCRENSFFVLDADIIVPKYFKEWLKLIIKPGLAYFPICYRLNKDKEESYNGDEYITGEYTVDSWGGWANKGYGLFGLTIEDWKKYKFEYNEEIGNSWGIEDDDIYLKCIKHVKILRHNCPGLIHLWHPSSIEYRNINHVDNNHYDLGTLISNKRKKYFGEI